MVSALFFKADAAVAAVDGDLALAPGNAQILAAVGTPEIAVIPVPVYGTAHFVPADDRAG